jgi:hypothetical protein
MKTIKLTQGKVALVDDSDFEALSKFKWCARRGKLTWYAGRCRSIKGRKTVVYMHRQIMGFPAGEVDHRDGDGLHNWRENLRSANRSQQTANSRRAVNSSGFRGVRLRGNRFYAQICFGKKSIHLGAWATAYGAAKAYDEAARRYHGAFAVLNFGGVI